MTPRPPTNTRSLLIAGPCSAETPQQIETSIQHARSRGVDFIRISLWKPRTKPGFDGMQEAGIPLLAQAARQGVNPATEVMVPQQAEQILDAVLPALQSQQRLMLWIGARNQNHFIQQDIARIAAQDSRVVLMVKNQPWRSESHWEGIADHCLSSGIAPQNLILCHRGFTPETPDSRQLRNVPDSDMAMRLRQKTGLAMVLDVSHTAGSVDNIECMMQEAVQHPYDGIVVEVHPNPRFAWTDAKQQITWTQLDCLLDQTRIPLPASRKAI